MMIGNAPPDVFIPTKVRKIKKPLSQEGESPLIIYEIQINFNNLPCFSRFTIYQRMADAGYILEFYRRFSRVLLPDNLLR
jgi:hypothetical protein